MSYRTQAYDTQQGVLRTRDATVSRTTRLQKSRDKGSQHEPVRSVSNHRPQLSPSAIEAPRVVAGKPRLKPSGIPKSTTKSPPQKPTVAFKNAPSSISVTRPSHGHASTFQEVPLLMDSKIYTKETTAEVNVGRPSRPSEASRGTRSPSDAHFDPYMNTTMSQNKTTTRQVDLPPRLIPELQALAASTARHQDLYTKSSSTISSPSTQFSNTPSPWSVSTTTTTPTSWSSTSPGIVSQVPVKPSTLRSQTVPLPAAKRDKRPKMPALPETYTSMSPPKSPVTISQDTELRKVSKKRTPLHSPAPTPPPRTSSAKQALSRSSSRSDQNTRRHGRELAASSSDVEVSPLANHGNDNHTPLGANLNQSSVTRAHNELQQSLSHAPPRPSRKGVLGLEDSRPIIVNTHRSGFTSRHRELLDSGDEDSPHGTEPRRVEVSPTQDFRPTTPREVAAPIPSSPSRLGKFSAFGIFGRRGKSPAADVERSPRKLQRKGPAAGTGHEGYGKYGRRGRKASQEGSSTNNSESERSVSSTRRNPLSSKPRKESRSESNSRPRRSSQSDLDDFAASRLKPVPILGGSGGSVAKHFGNRSEAESTDTLPRGYPVETWETPSQSQTSIIQQPSAGSHSPLRKTQTAQQHVPSLAIRRSQRFRHEPDTFNLPTPIRTEALSAPLYISSHDTTHSSVRAASTSTPSTTAEPSGTDASQKTGEKKARKLRWNIFRRKQSESAPEKRVPVFPSASPEEMPVSISAIPVSRPMPYYAMMDSESEIQPNEHVGEFLAQVVESPVASPFITSYEPDEEAEDENDQPVHEEVFLPSASVSPLQSFERSPPPVSLQSPIEQIHVQIAKQPRKQPRLARVGRIPPVVFRQEREHRPSRASFSQPFVRSPPLEPSEMRLNTSNVQANTEEQLTASFSTRQLFDVVDQTAPVDIGAEALSTSEFLRFPSRQASELSSSSASEGSTSLFISKMTAGLPDNRLSRLQYQTASDEHFSPSLDEIWNEYDDFIDHVMSPSQLEKSNRLLTNQGGSAHEPEIAAYIGHVPGSTVEKRNMEVTEPDHASRELKRTVFAPAMATSATPPVIFPLSTLPERSVGEEIRLRRSRIATALHSSMEPVSPFSIRDLISEYAAYQRDSARFSERTSTSTAGYSMERLTPSVSLSDVLNEPSHQENVALLDVVERSKDPAAQSELHYASLMVAKWLSFGRVLFSPAHDGIQEQAERHVLVIDGLGSEDWSIYCAVTYEDQRAFVHTLKEKVATKASKEFKSATNAPSNHRRAEVASFYDKFPFPPNFFSAVVLRFPPAMAEAKMKNMIAECRRVLVPGGYLELMLLDLDIVNMGVQTRRAVRELKLRMTTADRQISLRPIIDNVQGVLGARGFSNISRCVVGVPVAGSPNVSGDSPSSSRSSGGSEGRPKRGSGDSRTATASPRMKFGAAGRGQNISLNDLIADHSDNADAKIGKIVSTTARRWWQHCFEAAVISDGNLSRSIFADKSVLSECKGRGSSFKMLIAYAQRPDLDARRRTMSEPAISTMATAGSRRPSQPLPLNARATTK